MISAIRRTLYPVTSKFLSHATLVEGRLKGTESPFRCLFVDNSDFSEHLRGRIFEEPLVVLRKSRIWIPALRRHILSNADSFDLCIAVLPMKTESSLRGAYDYKCTKHIRQVIDTSGSWEEIRSKFSRKTRQITNAFQEKHGLSYRIANSGEEFDHFYYDMHVPLIQKRYGKLSVVQTYESTKKHFNKGRLLFVTKNDMPVAGALSVVKDGALNFRQSGVLDGDESHIKGGAQLALYYFQIMYAKENNLHAVDAGWSAPFLNDGVYMHKRAWGAAVFPADEERDWAYLFNTRPSERIAQFFEKNPLIVYSDQGLKGVIGVAGETDITTEAINELVRRYQDSGLHGFTIVTRTGALSVE